MNAFIKNGDSEDSLIQSMISSPLEVSISSINNLNIIINDHECSDSFFDAVCKALEEKGIAFTVSHLGNGINVDNSVVVTLDMQYSSGDYIHYP